MISDGGAMLHNGTSHAAWLQLEHPDDPRAADWPRYVQRIRAGGTWPGILEIQRVARLYDANIQVFVREEMEFKRISNIRPAAKRVVRLDYQNASHFEPLMLRPSLYDRPAPAPCPANIQSEGDQQPFVLLLANISSHRCHHEMLYDCAEQRHADLLLLTETRIRDDRRHARLRAATAGFDILMSRPRPLKANNVPREGGVALLRRAAAVVDATTHRPTDDRLNDDYALHSVVDLGAHHLLHIIVGYCATDAVDQYDHLLQYAASLGPVPVIIGCGWNTTVDALLARSPGWHDPAAHLAVHRPSLQSVLAQPTTIRHDGAVTRRVDFYLVNDHALQYIRDVSVLTTMPMANHFPVELVLQLPNTTARVPTLVATKDFRKASPTIVAQQWLSLAPLFDDEWALATANQDTDKLWQLWTDRAERALAAADPSATPPRTTAPKGELPRTALTAALAPGGRPGAVDLQARRLARLSSQARRLHYLKTHPVVTARDDLAATNLTLTVAAGLNEVLPTTAQPSWADLPAVIEAVDRARDAHQRLLRTQRLQAWRHRVGHSLRHAHRWLQFQ